ncbi:MAG: hypothetical protein RID53_12455 [Coleofasciculus sp. B1-GNL1-01]|uniref:hypothetical protein n=1 Tax=Coleofasciculus sp. B1-GNL1-01 TaxID=3068484 RepID=UPI0032F65DF2
MSLDKLMALIKLLDEVRPDPQATLTKYQHDPDFAQEIDSLFQILSTKSKSRSKKRRTRRRTSVFDPVELYHQKGEKHLREQLQQLEVEQLKDMIAEHGMDSSRRAMRWKKRDRLIELIVKTASCRARKGDAFR